MSANDEKDLDREAALANLSPEERAALEIDEYSPEERENLKAIAGEGGDDDAADTVQAAAGAGADTVAGAAAADTVVAATGDDDEGAFRPAYQAKLPDDFNDQLAELDAAETELAAKFKAGDIETDEFLAENRRITGERLKLNSASTKADIASEMGDQTAEQEWKWNVGKFIRQVKKTEGIDYQTDAEKGNDFDSFVKVLAANPNNGDKTFEWFLTEAHKRTKALHGIADKKADTKVVDTKVVDTKPASRKPPTDKLPITLAQVPGGDGPGDVSDEFGDIDGLEGIEYEQALASLTPAQRGRYLAAA